MRMALLTAHDQSNLDLDVVVTKDKGKGKKKVNF